MVSPAPVDAEDATVQHSGSIVVSSSQSSGDSDDEQCDSPPPSPELGMAREVGIRVEHLELEEGEEENEAAGTDLLAPLDTHELCGTSHPNDGRVNSCSGGPQTQRSPPTSTQEAKSEPTELQSPNVNAACPPVRRSARAKSTLVYDQKYHPMDDFIRPSQAAKRRSLHGEQPLLGECSDDENSSKSGSDKDCVMDDTDNNYDASQSPRRGRKRKRSQSQTPEPTRRSSRRKAKPKVSYNIKIHPQDSDLERAYAYDGSNSSPLPIKKAGCSIADSPQTRRSLDKSQKLRQSLLVVTSDDALPLPLRENSEESPAQKLSEVEPARKQPVKLGDAYPDLRPDVAYLTGNHGSWPEVQGLPFCVYTERIEDQLNAEAEAASPLHYEDDDKENDVVNPELLPTPNPLDGLSIIPASYYRRCPGRHSLPIHSSIASNAFYLHPQFEALPYGLGWSDGEHDASSNDTHDCPLPDYMRILASSESLPRSSTSAEPRTYSKDVSTSSSPLKDLTGLDLRR